MNILFICNGNVCRSPLAAALLKKKFKDNNIPGEVSSAGFESFNINEPPDSNTQEIAKSHNLELEHSARIFRKSDFQKFDKIYVMDTRNFRDVKDLTSNDAEREKVDYLMNVIKPGKSMVIPDPYFSGKIDLEEIYDLLDEVTDKLVEMYNNK
jgi:protein-tyrosine phosphatase